MKKIMIYMMVLCLPSMLSAAESRIDLLQANIDIRDQSSLQRGAKFYMNYCSGCHSLQYLRYERMAKDLGLTTFDGDVDKDLVYNNLIFTQAKLHDPIKIAMPEADAREWFGVEPPDLTLIARVRGADWIYTYLKSFYVDDSRPFGANNLVVPGVAMPNVLANLQGQVIAVSEKNMTSENDSSISHLLLTRQGTMSQQEFDRTVEDIVNFLVYVGEPVQLLRYKMGIGVLIFLMIFLVLAYLLKKAYWRKLH